MAETRTSRRTFLQFAIATSSIFIPDWGQRVFPMYPRNRVLVPTGEPLIEILHDGRVVDFVKPDRTFSGSGKVALSAYELKKILEMRVGSVGGALELVNKHAYSLAAEERRLSWKGPARIENTRRLDYYRTASGWSIQVGGVEWVGGNHIRIDRRTWRERMGQV